MTPKRDFLMKFEVKPYGINYVILGGLKTVFYFSRTFDPNSNKKQIPLKTYICVD